MSLRYYTTFQNYVFGKVCFFVFACVCVLYELGMVVIQDSFSYCVFIVHFTDYSASLT